MDDADLSAAFRAADATAVDAQAKNNRWTALQLTFLVLAAVFGTLPGELTGLRIGPFLAFLSFGAAIALQLMLATESPGGHWHHARSHAEALKTLAWTYGVCGVPFVATLDHRDADLLYAKELDAEMGDFADFEWEQRSDGNAEQITDAMRTLRASTLEERTRRYTADRLSSQQRWYATRSERVRRLASRWSRAAVGASIVGLVGAALRVPAALDFDVDILGIAATFAASATAWAQSKQFRLLSTSYAATAGRLASFESIDLPLVEGEEQWATFVRRVEDIIGNENALWLARRSAAG
jgi:SMODS and SLOG-associating 2TM effector domain 3/SMODS and SLOG-associating 2TM effector domain 1